MARDGGLVTNTAVAQAIIFSLALREKGHVLKAYEAPCHRCRARCVDRAASAYDEDVVSFEGRPYDSDLSTLLPDLTVCTFK